MGCECATNHRQPEVTGGLNVHVIVCHAVVPRRSELLGGFELHGRVEGLDCGQAWFPQCSGHGRMREMTIINIEAGPKMRVGLES